MSDKISDLLEEAAARAVPVVAGISDDDLAAPTPCERYRVGDLLRHLFQVVVAFQELAAKRDVDLSSPPGPLPDGWRNGFRQQTALLVRAWSEPGAEDGTTGAMGLPARTVGSMVLLDLTVHPWDLARATGEDFQPADRVLGELTDLVTGMGPTGRSMGAFGEPVPVAPEAGRFAQLLGATGRDPSWTPPTR